MPDDDRSRRDTPRRRLGDETKGRIADLASGWGVDEPAAPEPKAPTPAKTPTPKPTAMVKPTPAAKTPTPKPRGDETNARIAELASGWSVDAADTPEESPALPPIGRKKQKTLPPPPPGSSERKALEAAIVESSTGPTPKSAPIRADKKTSPPPLPPTIKSGANAKPPSTVKSGPTETGTVNVSGVIGGGLTPAPVILKPSQVPGVTKSALPLRADTTDRTGPPPAPLPPPPAVKPISQLLPEESGEATEVDPGAHLTVPIGEFDQPSTLLEQDKLRIAYEQSTIKRDAASALLGMPEPPLTVVKEPPVDLLLGETAAHLKRGDSTGNDPATSRFERGDPTTIGSDQTTIEPPSADFGAGGKLRAQAALRRKRGIMGDVRYVATAAFGVRRARRELGDLELAQAQRQKSRARHLLTLGRAAVIAEGYDHPALSKARELLAVVEDERAQHAAAVTAADSELMRVRTDRNEKAKAYADGITALDAELAEIAKKLEPLEKEVALATRRATELHEALRRIDGQIAQTEASKVAVKGPRLDPAAIQAELATLKADRLAVERDEPRIAAELDALNPRVAALEARRTEARKKRAELEDEEKKDQGRSQELLAAIGAKRKVVDRASADAEEMRDKILLELGERIYVDRPDDMFAQLAPIDAIDVELGTTDRRMMELRELIGSVDKAKLARGIAVIVLVIGAIATLTVWLMHLTG